MKDNDHNKKTGKGTQWNRGNARSNSNFKNYNYLSKKINYITSIKWECDNKRNIQSKGY